MRPQHTNVKWSVWAATGVVGSYGYQIVSNLLANYFTMIDYETTFISYVTYMWCWGKII